jgi:EAL domain-containing protein (putative c-di-GMP-specific phosphodiesterase class I)
MLGFRIRFSIAHPHHNRMINERAIRAALDRQELVFFYQAKVSLITGKVTGAEALIRWQKPDGQIIMPGEFIPLAEKTGLIKSISERMFAQLARDMLIIHDIDPLVTLAFNASAKDFEDDQFCTQVRNTLNQLHIPAQNLQIEITESVILQPNPTIRKNIQALCDAGIQLVMDDYGTGYANLETLRRWPFSSLKLDRSIIKHILDSPKNQVIAESSIRMAHELDLNVIAEGVESERQYQMLLEFGCTKVQGYWISHPLPLQDFIYFLEQDLRWSGLPVGLIHMAVIDHIQWRKKLTSDVVRLANMSLDAPERLSVYQLPMDYRDCRLGRWYYGVGQQFANCSIFQSIELPHKHFHSLGKQLVSNVNQGGSLRELTPILTEFSEQSAIILDRLQQLAHKGLMDMYLAHNNWRNHNLYPDHKP